MIFLYRGEEIKVWVFQKHGEKQFAVNLLCLEEKSGNHKECYSPLYKIQSWLLKRLFLLCQGANTSGIVRLAVYSPRLRLAVTAVADPSEPIFSG